MKKGRPTKYSYNINDIVDDYKCIEITTDNKGWMAYKMQCQICGKEKIMRGSTIALHKGTSHKNCGKGLGVSVNKTFYNRWQSMRARTMPDFWNHQNYYDRGINSDAFASFKDFYDTMYDSWLEHSKKYGEDNTSLERIDVDLPYSPSNCTWICLDEQKGNMQKTIYFTVTDLSDNSVQYYKNANKYCADNNLPNYIGEVINKNGIYKGKQYHRITKEEYQANI